MSNKDSLELWQVEAWKLATTTPEQVRAIARELLEARATISALRSRVAALEGANTAMRAVLEKVGKGYRRSDEEDDWMECPCCHGWIDHYGHDSNCDLIAAITKEPTP